jgi:SanA protein
MKYLKIILLFVFACFAFVLFSYFIVEVDTQGDTFTSTASIPKNKVGLVLGTSRLTRSGRINYYFKHRIDATVKLYRAGKIDFVLVSGDNGHKGYDEPTDFKNALIEQGIPEDKIFLDYAGFRTLDSVVRAKEVFGQHSFTVISQEFHNERAIFLANRKGIQVVGFNAKDVRTSAKLKMKLREYLARTKAVLDIIFGVKPKFLGEKIEIK